MPRWSVDDPNNIQQIKTSWRYDLAGRRVKEIDAADKADSTVYDEAGNPTSWMSRRYVGLDSGVPPVQMVYDEANRLKYRTIPAYQYPQRL